MAESRKVNQKKVNSLKLPRVFSALEDKLALFKATTPNGTPSTPMRADEIRQKKIDYYEEEFKLAVAGNYRKYRFPYKTLGERSAEADSLICDEERILSAYNLFKAVREANASFASHETKIIDDVITCPLTQMEQYTTGDEFVYLQAWLYFEKRSRDFIPYMYLLGDGSTYIIRFMPASSYRWNYKDKEVFAIIQAAFYPTDSLPGIQ